MSADALFDALVAAVADRVVEQLEPRLQSPAEPWRLVGVADVAVVLGRSPRWVHGAVRSVACRTSAWTAGARLRPELIREWALER
jgi:hypothetical protein